MHDMSGEGPKAIQGKIEEIPVVPPKPAKVTIEHLTLRGKTGMVEKAYLYSLVESWYGIKKDEIFKKAPTHPLFDERALLKVLVLTQEGWSSDDIALALDPPREGREPEIEGLAVNRARSVYLNKGLLQNDELRERERWDPGVVRYVAQTLLEKKSLDAIQVEGKTSRAVLNFINEKGSAIKKRRRREENPVWIKEMEDLSAVGAFLVEFGGASFEQAREVVQQLQVETKKKRLWESDWNETRMERLARALAETESVTNAAKQLDVSKNAAGSIMLRVGKKALKEETGPEWDKWRRDLNSTSAFLVKYGKQPFERAIGIASRITRNRTRQGRIQKASSET
jgi:hypothetical protein